LNTSFILIKYEHKDGANGAKQPAAKLGRSNVPSANYAARRPIFNKSGEEIFDLNDPAATVESADGMGNKLNKIHELLADVKKVFMCDDSKHHGCCWISPPNSAEPGKHYQMDNTLQWSLAKIVVSDHFQLSIPI